MTIALALHPALDFEEVTPKLEALTWEECQDVNGGGPLLAGLSWGARAAILAGGIGAMLALGVAVGVAVYVVTH